MTNGLDSLLYLAYLAEQMGRFDDMVAFVHEIVTASEDRELNAEARCLIAVAFGHAVERRCSSHNAVTTFEQKQKLSKGKRNPLQRNENHTELIAVYRKRIENELTNLCNDALDIIDIILFTTPSITMESKVICHRMEGDYNRCLAEFTDDKYVALQNAHVGYEKAFEIATVSLPKTNRFRLAVVLNYTEFLVNVARNVEGACKIASKEYDEAVAELGTVSRHSYLDSFLVLHSLLENLLVWKGLTAYAMMQDSS